MAEPPAISADDVAGKQFATTFRGFDQHEVRAYLATLARELTRLAEEQAALRGAVELAQERHAASMAALATPTDDLDAALGVETARVLQAARIAAQEIRTKAEEHVARLVRESSEEASRLRVEAESILSLRTREAEETVSALLAEARQQGRAMVAEAQAVRDRVLKDLARRKRLAVAQIEVLEQGRVRLAGAFDAVRATLDEAAAAVVGAVDDAQEALTLAAERPAAAEEPAAEAAVVAPSVESPSVVAPSVVAPSVVAPSVVAPSVESPRREPEPEIAEPVAEAEAPVESPGPQSDDRRSSSLRLLRRRPEETVAGSLEPELEGVRIIRPEPVTPAPAVLTVVPEPDAEPEPEPEPEPVEPEPVEPEPVAPEPVAPEPVAQDGGAGRSAAVGESVPVDDLFARLRAGRAAAVAEAEVVLARADDRDADEPETDADVVSPEPVEEAPEPVTPIDDTPFERRDALLEEGERALTRVLKRALADEQNEVLDALRRRKGAARLDALLPPVDEQRSRFAEAATAVLQASAAAGATSVAGAVTRELPDVAGELAAELAADVRARLGRAVESTGSDDEALVEAISGTYREWKTARIEPLARHFTAAAFAAGAFAVAPEGPLRWTVDPAEGGCPDCDDNALAGATTRGETFPTGQVHPPAHAGCRCLALPAG